MTGGFFPCQLALVRKPGKTAEERGLGEPWWPTVREQVSCYHSQKGKLACNVAVATKGNKAANLRRQSPLNKGKFQALWASPGTAPPQDWASLNQGKSQHPKALSDAGETVTG